MSLATPPPLLRVPRRPSRGASPGAALRSMGRAASGAETRYSRRVALLKRLLPAIGLALLLLITIWPRLTPLWERMRLSFPAIDLRDARELRMLNPRYVGTDRLNRPFAITAASGRQVPDRQDLMSLETPRAEMKTHGGTDVVVTAASGIYQSQAQLLDLFGEVTLVHENGTRFVTSAARLDIAHNAAQGDNPIEGHGPSGDVKAQGFRIYDKGDTIVFTGRSDMLVRSTKAIVGGSDPPALPAAVAATAAQVEAEGRPMLAAAARRHGTAAHRPATKHHAAGRAKPGGADKAHHRDAKHSGPKTAAKKRER